MLESAVERKLKKGIEKLGGLCYKFVSPGRQGVPDRICLIEGMVFFVELKRGEGVLAPLQRVEIERIRSKGTSVFVVYGAEGVSWLLETVKEAIDSGKKL